MRLGSELLRLAGVVADEETARHELDALISSGAAAQRMEALIEAQGGDPRVVQHSELLPAAPLQRTLVAWQAGTVGQVDARGVADAVLELGGARRQKDDPVDPRTGVRLLIQIGDDVERGQPLAEVHAADEGSAAQAERRLRSAIRITE